MPANCHGPIDWPATHQPRTMATTGLSRPRNTAAPAGSLARARNQQK